MYSAPGASRKSHAKYTASTEKKSWGLEAGEVDVDTPGLRYRVGLDLMSLRPSETTRCVAESREDEDSSPLA
jgi:hypothetical protein